LMEHGIIYPTSRIESTWLHVLPYGYPIPTLNRDKELQKAHKALEMANIYSRGRFGSWRYEAANQDHSFTMGTEIELLANVKILNVDLVFCCVGRRRNQKVVSYCEICE
ncbi:hypothetical protein TELCIR_18194, partial [Teladorsagia circumcincta]